MIDSLVDIQFIFLLVEVIVILVASFVIVRIFNRLLSKMTEGRIVIQKKVLPNIQRFIQLLTYSIACILIFSLFDVDITGLIAGLGVGALVLSFALKDIIENWVSGLIIISGKTYRVGDIIVFGNSKGVVTDISLRTTKIKTYDRNEINVPNSLLLKERIVNLTSGEKECISSVIFYIDYAFNIDKVKKVIESILRTHPNVTVDEKKRREIRSIIRSKEWTTEIESLFWINDPENEEFIKSRITELIKEKFEEEGILPPIPPIIRKDFLKSKEQTA